MNSELKSLEKENKTRVYYTKFETELPEFLFEKYFSSLSFDQQMKNVKYRRWQDRYSHLFGLLLLIKGLEDYGYSAEIVDKIRLNAYGRPFLKNGNIDFNISHSGSYVLCALGKGVKLGVDVEQIRNIELSVFDLVMNKDQWNEIKKSNNPLETFYKFWAIKESVIKADSRGMGLALDQIQIEEKKNQVMCEERLWYYKELRLDRNYSSFVSSNVKFTEIVLRHIDFNPGARTPVIDRVDVKIGC